MKYYMGKLAKLDFSKCYGMNSMTTHATVITVTSYFNNFVFALMHMNVG